MLIVMGLGIRQAVTRAVLVVDRGDEWLGQVIGPTFWPVLRNVGGGMQRDREFAHQFRADRQSGVPVRVAATRLPPSLKGYRL